MKKTIALLTSALCFLPIAGQCATGFFGNLYFITNTGGGNVFNQVRTGTTPGAGAAQGHNLGTDGVNPQFLNFGTINIASTFLLKGFEYKTWNDNFSNVSAANLFYRIYPTGSPSGTFGQISTTTPTNISGNDKTWQVTNQSINLLSGLTNGNYTIQIYTESYTNIVNTASNIFGFALGGNPTATFTVIPEPSHALLAGLGLGGMFLRRRRS